jgi:lysophospholipase L1-like esterase
LKKRLVNLLKNLALSCASFLIFLGLIEIALRIAGFGNLEVYQPDPLVYWKLKANQDCYTKVGRKPVHINSRGTRGPEFEIPKPPGIIRILCLGDSRTFGWGVREEDSYSGVLEKTLSERTGKKVEVINAGVNAWSFPQMKVYFEKEALQFNPDFVVLAEANLWTQFSEKNSPEFVQQFMNRVRLKNFLRRFALYHYLIEIKLQKYYAVYRSKFIPVNPAEDALFKEQQQNDPDAVFRDAIGSICRTAQEKRVRPVLLGLPIAEPVAQKGYERIFRVKEEIAKKLDVPLLDLTTNLLAQGNALYLEADPVHFNEAGNKIIGEKLSALIAEQIVP